MTRPVNILFVCIGNACRSQMAEALARHLGGDYVHAWSAGIHPTGWIPPQVADVLAEKGIDMDGQWSKGLEAVVVNEMDIFVCMATEIHCAAPSGFSGRLIDWDIPDPYGASMEFFREVRDLIESNVRFLLDEVAPSREQTTESKPQPTK